MDKIKKCISLSTVFQIFVSIIRGIKNYILDTNFKTTNREIIKNMDFNFTHEKTNCNEIHYDTPKSIFNNINFNESEFPKFVFYEPKINYKLTYDEDEYVEMNYVPDKPNVMFSENLYEIPNI